MATPPDNSFCDCRANGCFINPGRVTVTGPDKITGLLPPCPECHGSGLSELGDETCYTCFGKGTPYERKP